MHGTSKKRRDVTGSDLWRLPGKKLFMVPKEYTSQTCHACGHSEKDNRRKDDDGRYRTFRCLKCGNEDNADRNAALNIRRIYLSAASAGCTSLDEAA